MLRWCVDNEIRGMWEMARSYGLTLTASELMCDYLDKHVDDITDAGKLLTVQHLVIDAMRGLWPMLEMDLD